jgi:hypothetical protein
VPWNDKPLFAVGHHDVAALPGNVEAKFFKDPHSVALADGRKFWHKLNGDKFAGKTRAVSLRLALSIFLGYFEPELNGLANVGQRFVMRRALTVATGQCGAGNGEAFFGFDHDDLILHGFKIRSAEMQIKLICRRRDIFVEPNPNQIQVLAHGHHFIFGRAVLPRRPDFWRRSTVALPDLAKRETRLARRSTKTCLRPENID